MQSRSPRDSLWSSRSDSLRPRRKSACGGNVVNPNDFFSRVQGLTSGTRHYFRTTIHAHAQLRGLHVQRYNVAGLVWERHPVAAACRKLLKTLSPSLSFSFSLSVFRACRLKLIPLSSPFLFFTFLSPVSFSRRTRTSVRRNR